MKRQLTSRLDRIPADVNGVRTHIKNRDVRIGSFLQRYDTAVQTEVLSLPTGRGDLSRGDSGYAITMDGSQCLWGVVAVIDGTTLINVVVSRGGRSDRRVSVAWLAGRPLSSHGDSTIRELFSETNELRMWDEKQHCLDLWNWRTAVPFTTPNGVKLSVDQHIDIADSWEVMIRDGGFTWTPVNGRNIISDVVRLSSAIIESLFVSQPEGLP